MNLNHFFVSCRLLILQICEETLYFIYKYIFIDKLIGDPCMHDVPGLVSEPHPDPAHGQTQPTQTKPVSVHVV